LSTAGDIGTHLAAFAGALVASLAATPIARRVALRFDILDHPDERKDHSGPTPYMGGLGIVVAFVATMAVGALVIGIKGEGDKLALLLGGGLLLAIVGLVDDIRPVSWWIKGGLILALAAALWAVGVRAGLFGIWQLDLLLTLGWVLGITSAVNFLDNMDGLTAGVAAIAAAYIAVLTAIAGQVAVASLAAAVAGCALGFLWHNRPPARIFMGDMGALFLGWLLAALSLELRFDNLQRVTFFVPIAVLAVPIFDTAMISMSRIRRGFSPLKPGLDHTSHRLVRLGIPRTAAVGLHYVAALACGWLGVVIAFAQPSTAYLLMAWIVSLGLFLAVLLMQIDVDGRGAD
jgi:UDP-GlcNAc:undecaprenyl-phosphate GlcNAc-1-phosphate transferase